MPQGSVRSSMIFLSTALIFSRSDEQLVQLDLAQNGAQRGLRELAGGVEIVLDLDDAFSGSATRIYRTAFTFTETLSRVMTSCGGISSATIRSETRLVGETRRDEDQPGPLVPQ